jgi:hypothetical protein
MNKLYRITFFFLIVLLFACNGDEEIDYSNIPGNPPASIDNVIDIMEISYGEEKEVIYNGQVFKFSVTDLEDDMDISMSEGVGMHADIHVETEKIDTTLRVFPLVLRGYLLDGRDEIKDIRDLLESFINRCPKLDDETCFKLSIFFMFGEGTMIENTPLSIYMTKAYHCLQHHQKENKSIYKFVFIITD